MHLITKYNNLMSNIITILDKVDTYRRIFCREVLESNTNLTLRPVYIEDRLEFGSVAATVGGRQKIALIKTPIRTQSFL